MSRNSLSVSRSTVRFAAWLALACAGCTTSPAAHPAHGCAGDTDCATGQRCHRGFCVADGLMDAGPPASDACRAELACNGDDEDCDGNVDEFAEPDCDTGLVGACGRGEWVCSAGAPSCARTTLPATETCNGTDDDCDARTDEGPPTSCYPDGTVGCTLIDGSYVCNGTCGHGTAVCGGGTLGECMGEVLPLEESCGGETATDEDCDGGIDEGCACTDEQVCYGGPAGTAGVGACRAGIQACDGGALDPLCAEQVVPRLETCLNPDADDDCNGVDDDVAGLGDPCTDLEATGDCRLGVLACDSVAAPTCALREPRAETCDGNDEDCDGRVDETIDLSADPAHCGVCGNACGDEETCCGGTCVDPRTSSAHCGACTTAGGESCGASEVCCGGECADSLSCGSCVEDCAAEGRTCCRGACVDVANDEGNCGGCGVACGAGQLCCAGACVGSDATHCGQSCTACATGSELCCTGACVPVGNDHCNACGVACVTGDCCGAGCVDLVNDDANCGTCNNICPEGQGCNRSHCCPNGQTWCEALGACRNLASDATSCGSCGNNCGGGFACCGGMCRLLGLGC